MWFERLTGFRETSPAEVREQMTVSGRELHSRVTGAKLVCGELEVVSLAELRRRVEESGRPSGKLALSEVIADVQQLHLDLDNAGAAFQVASQFNLLEMVSPRVTPERGVDIYENDFTQGPACAIAAGAGTIYRNYFASVNGQTGQSADNQIDCLAGLGEMLGNSDGSLWEMQNGYALASAAGLERISERLEGAEEEELDRLRGAIRIGIQWGTQVTLNDSRHLVNQIYCSALPVAYSPHVSRQWEAFARLVLEAAYEATLCAGVLGSISTGNQRVYLTLLGGGAFGNDSVWIVDAIERAVGLCREEALVVKVVSFRAPNEAVQRLLARIG